MFTRETAPKIFRTSSEKSVEVEEILEIALEILSAQFQNEDSSEIEQSEVKDDISCESFHVHEEVTVEGVAVFTAYKNHHVRAKF